MKKKFRSVCGSSVIEYMALVAFVLAVFLATQRYAVRAFSAKWKESGDSFGHGEQLDPRWQAEGPSNQKGTRECFYDPKAALWVNTRCFQQRCATVCRQQPVAGVHTDPLFVDDCTPCLTDCSANNPSYADCALDVN